MLGKTRIETEIDRCKLRDSTDLVSYGISAADSRFMKNLSK